MQSPGAQWVVLELSAKAESEDPDLVRASIRHHIRDAEVFVPASIVQRGEQRVYHYLMEGYAFILDRHSPGQYARLEDTKYVQSPLYISKGPKRERKIATVPQSQIDQLRRQIKAEVDQGIEIGDTVLITSGPYKSISAVVKEEIREQDAVTVHIQLRSTDRLVTMPRAFLRLLHKSPLIVYRPRLESVQSWIRAAQCLLQWPRVPIEIFYNAVSSYVCCESWLNRISTIYRFVAAYHTQVDLSLVYLKWTEFQRLCSGLMLQGQVVALSNPLPDVHLVERKQRELIFLTSVLERILTIYSDVSRMTETRPVNLIVDGTQLYIRCSEAPGLSSLTDDQGRPTGGIVGFLRSLGSYKKRFPGAVVYVCWDGSSQRRKRMDPAYKANRSSRSEERPFGLQWLQETLPSLGVHQAFNPEEEADDVMASLVRGDLAGAPNVLVTTDRDLLQVVSEFTQQLCPAVGAGKEKLYDPVLVEKEYGVPPGSMVQLRALSGDSSDNIQGVPGFGLKTSGKVVKLYGTVSALLGSNLAGLGKAQVSNLRAHADQVRKNVDLLKLRDVSFSKIESNPDQTTVVGRLEGLGIKPGPIVSAFFDRQLTIPES